MNKAVEIDMTFEEDPGETIRLVAVVNDRGDLTSTQVYGFARQERCVHLALHHLLLV